MGDPVQSHEAWSAFYHLRDVFEARHAAVTKRFDRLDASLETILQKLEAFTARLDCVQAPVTITESNSTVPVKFDFPRFDGTGPLHWLFKAEQFFAHYNTPDDQRLSIAAMNMEGSALLWFQLLQKQTPISSWTALAKAVEAQFSYSRFDCVPTVPSTVAATLMAEGE